MELNWKSAVELLEERNQSLRQGRIRIEQLRKTRDEQWKTWLPRVGIYTSIQTSLENLGKLSFSDLNTSVAAPLAIPNPLTERALAFQNALSYLEARDSYQLTYRRQVTQLYRLFAQYESLLEQRQLQQDRGDTTGAAAINSAISQLELAANNQEGLLSLQGGLAQLLNMPGKKIVPVPSSRPQLNYEKRYKSFVPGKNYGELAMRLAAYQIQGALLREKGIKLARWPSFSLGGSTPPLYDSRHSGSDYLDAERIFLFGSLSKSYDLTGREAEAINTAEENTAFVKASLRLRLDQENREWIRLQTRYEQLLLRRQLAQERLDAVRKRTSGGSPSVELETLRSAREQLKALKSSQQALDLELWIWDENKWK